GGEQPEGREDLLVADRPDRAARVRGRRHRVLPAHGIADPDRAGDGFGLLDDLSEHQRRRALGLEAPQPRRRAELAEAAPVGGDVAGVADRDAQRLEASFKRLVDLERSRLLAFDTKLVDRVDEHDRVRARELAYELERTVEV